MDRRSFFRSALDKGGKTVINAVDASVRKQASRWIRPPFALDELEFILACTRCGDCIEACPHEVIFGLSARVGAKFAGTPALDLLNKGCHLCADWPCVNACEPDALVLPEPAPAPGKHATELRGTRRSKPVTAKLAGKLSTASFLVRRILILRSMSKT